MFNKLQFNNLVISNKKQIQQGRVQTVQKCVQKIRKLKCLLEKHAENQKYKDALRRILLVMEELKKLKRMQIIKNILLLEKKPSAVLTNGQASVAETATAMLALNSVLQKLIECIKSELQLNENDNSWCEALKESSRRRIKIERTEEKRRRRLEQKAQKALTRNRAIWLLNHQNKDEENENTSVVITRNGLWKEEDVGNGILENIIPSVKNTTNKLERVLKPKIKKNVSKTKTTLIQNNVKTESNQQINDTVTKTNKTEESIESTKKKKTVKHIVDPFFVTETGENYLATVGPNEPTMEEIEDGVGKNSIVGLQRRRGHENKLKTKERSFDSKRKITSNEKHNYINKNNIQNIHPSWEAKQHRKPIVAPFQGKKIKFSDNQNEVKPALSSNSFTSTSSELHPSWAAKQKLKPVITAFQGKKVVFDD